MGCFFVFQAFHVFFSGAEQVIVEKEHADDDASLDAAGGVDVLVSEVFTVDFDEIINDKHLSVYSNGVEDEEGVIAQEAS